MYHIILYLQIFKKKFINIVFLLHILYDNIFNNSVHVALQWNILYFYYLLVTIYFYWFTIYYSKPYFWTT